MIYVLVFLVGLAVMTLRNHGYIKLCSFADVALGEGRVRAFTLFECKRLCSLIFYKWETIDQVRFHSHAFASIAFLLWGSYDQQVIEDGKINTYLVRRLWWPRWLPRNYTHSIVASHGFTLSAVFTGPWQRTWWEFFPEHFDGDGWRVPGIWQEYGWGREKLRKLVGTPELVSLDPKVAATMLTYEGDAVGKQPVSERYRQRSET